MTPRPSCLVLAALLAAACAVSPAQDADTPPGFAQGDDLYRLGDFDGAVVAYERDLARQPDSPVLREKLLTARTRAAGAHADAALRAADAGDLGRAQAEATRADALAPGLPAVRKAQEVIGERAAAAQRASELRDRARGLLVADPDEADRLLVEAQRAAREGTDVHAEIVRLRREASLRAEAGRSADRAAEAWSRGDRASTVEELATAVYGGNPVARADAVRRRIEGELVAGLANAGEDDLRDAHEFAWSAKLHPSIVTLLRDRLVERLIAAAEDLRATSRPATAALLELEARRLRGDVRTPAYDQVRAATLVTILVQPFADETGGRVDGLRVARALRDRLAVDTLGGGVPLRVLDDSADARATHPDALVLSGTVLSARQTQGMTGREHRNVPYKSGTRRKANPGFDELARKLQEASAAVREAEDDHRFAVDVLQNLRAAGFNTSSTNPRIGDVEYRTRLAAAQAVADRAEITLSRAKAEEFDVRQALAVTPREVDEPVWSEHVLTVTTKIKTAQLTARVELASGDERLLAQDVSAAAQHRETVADAFPPGDVPEDPDETPDDATMAERAADRFAAAASGRVRAAAAEGARRHLLAARDAERAGRRDEAAELYSLYLLSTPETASPERAAAARALEELLGVHVALRTGESGGATDEEEER